MRGGVEVRGRGEGLRGGVAGDIRILTVGIRYAISVGFIHGCVGMRSLTLDR